MRRCADCQWWEPAGGEIYNPSSGKCHRNAPSAKGECLVYRLVWPTTERDDWCGEFSPYQSENSK